MIVDLRSDAFPHSEAQGRIESPCAWVSIAGFLLARSRGGTPALRAA